MYKTIVFYILTSITLAGFEGVTLSASSGALVMHAHAASVHEPVKTLRNRLNRLIGHQDAVVLVDPDGKEVYAHNATILLVPASTLKILTSLIALHYLGESYRFPTEFYMDAANNLKVKGYGDPFLVSETVREIAGHLSGKLTQYHDLVIDETYFQRSIVIPGRTTSIQPYDAPNGALCVNFNTVFFTKKNGVFKSAEEQTPLVPFALQKINQSGLSKGRIMLSSRTDEILQYAGEILEYFLNQEGIRSIGSIRTGTIQQPGDRLMLRYLSNRTIPELVASLLEYSNNFIANQLLIATGAHQYGPPGTIEKGLRAARNYIRTTLQLKDIQIVEGSGISRENRLSAAALLTVLSVFEPYHQLLRREGREYYKTGTLKGINTRAGYILDPEGRRYRFVVLVNTPDRTTTPVMKAIFDYLDGALL